MTSNLRIRTAGIGDPEWVIGRHGILYRDEFGFDEAFERDIADKMRAFLAMDDSFNRLWIAEATDRRVGSVAISSRADGSAFLNFVLVSPDVRGQGIAALLMDTAIDHARRNGHDTIHLETYSCLERARQLYSRCGFAIVETVPDIAKYGRTFDREFWSMSLHDEIG